MLNLPELTSLKKHKVTGTPARRSFGKGCSSSEGTALVIQLLVGQHSRQIECLARSRSGAMLKALPATMKAS